MIKFQAGSLQSVNAAQWDALLRDDQPFLKYAFLSSLEDSGSVGLDSGWQANHLFAHDADGVLQAAIPAYLKQHSFGEYVFDMAWADACVRAGIAYYPKLLIGVPFSPVSGARLLGESQVLAQMLDELSQTLDARGLSGVHLNFGAAFETALLEPRTQWLPRLGCQFHWHNRGYRDFDDFLQTLSSRKRKQFRKEREQVAGLGVHFEWRQGHELSELEWDFVYRCYANTYHVRGRLPYLTRTFFSLLAERMPQQVRVVFARQGSQPVAMALSLLGDGVLYGRYWGCVADFDRLHFETCLYQGIEYAIEQGLQRFDAGAQGEHKLVRGFEPVITRSWHCLAHHGLRAAVNDFLAQERPGVLAYAQQARSALPYRQLDA